MAVQHAILVAIWHMFTTGRTHEDLGLDHFKCRDEERRKRHHLNQLRKMGVESRSGKPRSPGGGTPPRPAREQPPGGHCSCGMGVRTRSHDDVHGSWTPVVLYGDTSQNSSKLNWIRLKANCSKVGLTLS